MSKEPRGRGWDFPCCRSLDLVRLRASSQRTVWEPIPDVYRGVGMGWQRGNPFRWWDVMGVNEFLVDRNMTGSGNGSAICRGHGRGIDVGYIIMMPCFIGHTHRTTNTESSTCNMQGTIKSSCS